MRAVWTRARSELRSHWRTLVALCLLAGIPGGVAIAAAIGASRTDSLSARVIRAEDPTDIFYSPGFQDVHLRFEDVARLPVVSAAYDFKGFPVLNPGFENLSISAPSSPIPRRFFKMLAGRPPALDSVDEVMISFIARDLFHWRVGTRVTLQLADPSSNFVTGDVKPGSAVTVRIVGIEVASGDLVGVADPGMMSSPAFERAFVSRAASVDLQTFKLRKGSASLAEFQKEITKLIGGRGVIYSEVASDLNQVRRTFHLQAVALWVACAVVGAVSLLIFGQAVARQSTLEADEYPALHALGMTRIQLTAVGLARALAVATLAAVTAVGTGIALSIATPLGLARIIEPQPGPWAPAAIVAIGCGAVLLAVVGCAAIPSWRAARSIEGTEASRARPSLPARMLGGMTTRPAPSIGARFALERGHGKSAVPVRSSLIAAVIGIVVLLGALTVGVSVRHFTKTPHLYGYSWDTSFDSGNTFAFEPGTKAMDELVNDPAISDASVGTNGGGTFRVNGVGMEGIAVDPIKGHLEPVVLEGRAVTGEDEVVLGRKSLQQIHAHIGSTVTVGVVGKKATIGMHVVGVAVFPFDSDTSTIGEGLWMSVGALRRMIPEVTRSGALIRFTPGFNRSKALAGLKSRFKKAHLDGEFDTPGDAPGGVRDYRRVSQVPLVLAGVLALLAVGTLAHLLVSSIRRRRRDLAILKSLGFEKGQTRGVVLWQAAVFTVVVLAIAMPLGIVVGRLTWNVIARYGGFASAPVVPLDQFGIACGAALLVALGLALLPARAAARTPPAVVLRTE